MVPAGDKFQKKTDELFSGMPDDFGIADDFLFAGFDEQGRDHDPTLDKVFRICSRQTWNLTKIRVFTDAPAFHSLVK